MHARVSSLTGADGPPSPRAEAAAALLAHRLFVHVAQARHHGQTRQTLDIVHGREPRSR